MHGRQLFATETGIGRRFIPADPTDRVIALALRIISRDPGTGPRLPANVDECRHRGFPGYLDAFLEERVLPELAALVPTGINEVLEVEIADFVPVEEEVPEIMQLAINLLLPAGNSDGTLRQAASRIKVHQLRREIVGAASSRD